MMKLLIISAEFPPLIGGIATFGYSLAKGLREMGYDVEVVTSVGSSGSERLDGMRVVRTPNIFNRRFLKIVPLFCASLWSCISRRPGKLILMTCGHEGLVGRVLRILFDSQYLVVVHGSEILQLENRKMLGWLATKVFTGAEMVVANSNYTRELLASVEVPSEKIIVVNPPIDLDGYDEGIDTAFVREKYALTGKRVILTVGRLVKRKGYKEVVEVLAQSKVAYPDLVYVLVGDGECRKELECLISSYGLWDRVRMTGAVSHTELQQLYKLCEIFITPSHEVNGDVEGFGIALLEAGVFSKPVIAGRSGGVEDAVVDWETGLLVNPHNVEDIKQKLHLLLEDRGLRGRLGRNGRDRVVRQFGLRKQSERLEHILRCGEETSASAR